MSDIGLILPPGVRLPEPIKAIEKPADDATEGEKASALPKPTGYKLLCIVPNVDEKFANSSLLKARDVMNAEELTSVVLFVLDVGPDAYADTKRFPNGPWCKKGDFVLTRTYAGTRFKIFGKEFRLLNDDAIDAVVADPRGITRA